MLQRRHVAVSGSTRDVDLRPDGQMHAILTRFIVERGRRGHKKHKF